jgi:hypothetical protein
MATGSLRFRATSAAQRPSPRAQGSRTRRPCAHGRCEREDPAAGSGAPPRPATAGGARSPRTARLSPAWDGCATTQEGQGVVHILVEDAAVTRARPQRRGNEVGGERDVLVVDVEDRPGTMGEVARRIGSARAASHKDTAEPLTALGLVYIRRPSTVLSRRVSRWRVPSRTGAMSRPRAASCSMSGGGTAVQAAGNADPVVGPVPRAPESPVAVDEDRVGVARPFQVLPARTRASWRRSRWPRPDPRGPPPPAPARCHSQTPRQPRGTGAPSPRPSGS